MEHVVKADPIQLEMLEAEQKAWDSLSRYKFLMFGYWAGVWVHLNRVATAQGFKRQDNPFGALVKRARAIVDDRKEQE